MILEWNSSWIEGNGSGPREWWFTYYSSRDRVGSTRVEMDVPLEKFK